MVNQDNKHRLEDLCNDLSLNTSRNRVGEPSKRSRSKSKSTCKLRGFVIFSLNYKACFFKPDLRSVVTFY